MSESVLNSPLLAGLVAAWMRALAGACLAVLCFFYPESHLLALADMPTLGTYAVLAIVGVQLPMTGAFDLRFLVIGVATWFVVVFIFAVVVRRLPRFQGIFW